MGATLGTNSWAYTDNDMSFGIITNSNSYFYYDGSEFKGDLYVCKSGCNGHYIQLQKEFCDYYDGVKKYICSFDHYEGYKINEVLQSTCLMYKNIYNGVGIYISFQSGAIICVFLWVLAMQCYWKNIKYLWLAHLSVGFMWAFQYIALISYMVVTNSSLTDDCNEFPDDGTPPKICAGAGPKLSMFIMAILPFVLMCHFVVTRSLQKGYVSIGLSTHAEVDQPSPVISEPRVDEEVVSGSDEAPKSIVGEGDKVECLAVKINLYTQASTDPPDGHEEH